MKEQDFIWHAAHTQTYALHTHTNIPTEKDVPLYLFIFLFFFGEGDGIIKFQMYFILSFLLSSAVKRKRICKTNNVDPISPIDAQSIFV